MVTRVVYTDLTRQREVQGAHRSVVVQPDARPLKQAEIVKGIEYISRVVKDGDAPVPEEGPLKFNAAAEELFRPYYLTGGITRAEGFVRIAAHALVAAGKETKRWGQIA